MLAEMNWGKAEPTPEQIENVAGELADVFVYVVNLADTLGIDVEEAVKKKLEKNEKRFPAHLFQDTTQDFDAVYMARKVELGERPSSVLKPGVPVRLPTRRPLTS